MWLTRPRGESFKKTIAGFSLLRCGDGCIADLWILADPIGKWMHYDKENGSLPCPTVDLEGNCHCDSVQKIFRRWYCGAALGWHDTKPCDSLRPSPQLPRHVAEFTDTNLSDLGDIDLAGVRIRMTKRRRGGRTNVVITGKDDLRVLPPAFDVEASLEQMWGKSTKRSLKLHREIG